MVHTSAGPTGRFPDGKLHDGDEGELTIAVWLDAPNQAVVLEFGTRISWMGMDADTARAIATKMIALADAIDKGDFE